LKVWTHRISSINYKADLFALGQASHWVKVFISMLSKQYVNLSIRLFLIIIKYLPSTRIM
jgi:hypothetical protein